MNKQNNVVRKCAENNMQFQNPIQNITRDKSQFVSLLHHSSDQSSHAVKDFIKTNFKSHYGADIHEFMPNLVSILNRDKKVRAVVGYRSAENSELFLEQYLNKSIDTYISDHCGSRVPRSEIVEVGNLACAANGYARLAIIRATELFFQSGFKWVSFTATQGLYNSFLRLGLTPHTITHADINRVDNSKNYWGTYYDNQPNVMFGSIEWGYNKLKDENFL